MQSSLQARVSALQQAQHQLSAPVDAPSELGCMRDATIFLRGYSELRQMSSWLHLALGCAGATLTAQDPCMTDMIPPNEAYVPFALYRNLSACRERWYHAHPHRTACNLNVKLHFEWKSLMWSDYDAAFRERVVEAARASASSRIVVVLNGGPHHFTKFHDHDHWMYHGMPVAFDYPQHWFDDYLASAQKLFEAFAPRSLPSNVCVLWRTSNVGARFPGAKCKPRAMQHPSSRNGMHDWLNRWAVALAKSYGIGVVDTNDLSSRDENGPPSARRGEIIEGDLYHGFNSSLLLVPFVERSCHACGPWRSEVGAQVGVLGSRHSSVRSRDGVHEAGAGTQLCWSNRDPRGVHEERFFTQPGPCTVHVNQELVPVPDTPADLRHCSAHMYHGRRGYMLSDLVKQPILEPNATSTSTSSNETNLWARWADVRADHLHDFPQSLAADYVRRTDHRMNQAERFAVLRSLVSERWQRNHGGGNLYTPRDYLVVHLRVGDVIEEEAHTLNEILHRAAVFSAANNYTRRYVRSLHWFRSLDFALMNVSRAYIIAGSHLPYASFNRSTMYVHRVRNVLQAGGLRVELRCGHDADDDLVVASHAKWVVISGGGFSNLLRLVARSFGARDAPRISQ